MITKPNAISYGESDYLQHLVNQIYEHIGVLTAANEFNDLVTNVSNDLLEGVESFRLSLTDTIGKLKTAESLLYNATRIIEYNEKQFRLTHCEGCGKETINLRCGLCMDCRM